MRSKCKSKWTIPIALLGVAAVLFMLAPGVASAATTGKTKVAVAAKYANANTANSSCTAPPKPKTPVVFRWAHVDGAGWFPQGDNGNPTTMYKDLASGHGQCGLQMLHAPSWLRNALKQGSHAGTQLKTVKCATTKADAMLDAQNGVDYNVLLTDTNPKYAKGVPSLCLTVTVNGKPVVRKSDWINVGKPFTKPGSNKIFQRQQKCTTTVWLVYNASASIPDPCVNVSNLKTSSHKLSRKDCVPRTIVVGHKKPAPKPQPQQPIKPVVPTNPTNPVSSLTCDSLGAVTVNGYTINALVYFTPTNVTVTSVAYKYSRYGNNNTTTDVTTNGVIGPGNTAMGSFPSPGPGVVSISVTVNGTDAAGQPISATSPKCVTSVTIPTPNYSCVSLAQPTVNGMQVTTVATYADANGAVVKPAMFNYSDGPSIRADSMLDSVTGGTATSSHTYTQPGAYKVSVQFSFGLPDGTTVSAPLTDACTKTVIISRPPPAQPPTCKILNPSINGSQVSIVVSYNAPTGVTLKSGTLDYGDGTGAMPGQPGPNSTFTGSHNYTTSGSFTITASLTFSDGTTNQTITCSTCVPIKCSPPVVKKPCDHNDHGDKPKPPYGPGDNNQY